MHPRSVQNQNFTSVAHEHNLFHMHFKKIELEPAIIWKAATFEKCCSWTRLILYTFKKNWTSACNHLKSSNLSADNFKKTGTQWVDTCARDMVSRCWSAETLFWQVSINIRLQAPILARKCEIKHRYACGADRRKVGLSVYGHMITEFSRMDRFSKVWGFELSPWSNKISAENFTNYVTSMDRKMSPRYSQVMMVRVYPSLTAVN